MRPVWVRLVGTKPPSDAPCLLFRLFCSNKSPQGRHCSCRSPPPQVLCSALSNPPEDADPSVLSIDCCSESSGRPYTVHNPFSPVCKMKYWFVFLYNVLIFLRFQIKLGTPASIRKHIHCIGLRGLVLCLYLQ